ncbi:MAG: hypothetical protein B7Z02_07155 [Rhodobacterales bacterium 32-67-9]|nr:MAG: hypothetical protein B7Z02_07155 [Rhodobacterales bacterium 32-67-9]
MKPPVSRRILVIEDDTTLNRLLVDQIGRLGHQTQGVGNRAQALETLARQRFDLAILDLRLPDADGQTFLPELREYCPAIVLTALGSIDQAVQAVRAGAADFLVKPANGQALELAISRALGVIDLNRDLAFWQGRARIGQDRPLLGSSPKMDAVRRLIALFAGADSPVLILGEDGAGKETCAMALHSMSPRSNGRFVSIDCDAGTSAEEIFGEMRVAADGRFQQSEGLLAAADTGTVYVGNVDRMPQDLQNRLLRVMETGIYRPVGSNVQMPCSARMLLGSSRSAADIVADSDPRSPHFVRMLSFAIQIPALRDRPGDICEMAEILLANRTFQRNTPKSFSPAALRAMQAHRWPGNLRELVNAVERAIIMSAGAATIEPEHLGIGPGAGSGPTSGRGVAGRTRTGEVVIRFDTPPSLDELRAAYLRLLIDMADGNRREIAAILGISERNLYRILPQLSTENDSGSQGSDAPPAS